MNEWNMEKGPESDVVISSRVRLARNLQDIPFPFKMDKAGEVKVINLVRSVISKDDSVLAKELVYIDVQKLDPIDKQVLVEKHLISPDMADSQKERGVFISKDEKASIMINEEDHFRVQSLFSGMQLKEAWELCNRIDKLLGENVDFAFDGKYGYLTCCPTNIGTGMRASTMLHLPALAITGYIKGVLEVCSKLGVTVRGLYGENSEASGNMFQISNQVSLGQTEEEILGNIANITFQIIEQERMLRSEMLKQNPYRLEDKVYRSFGLFSNARIISTDESLKLLSDVRMGVSMGIIKGIGVETLNEIMFLIQPASLQKAVGTTLSPDERDVKRAELIRSRVEKMNNQKSGNEDNNRKV